MSFRRYSLIVIGFIVFASCKQKKKATLTGDDKVEASDFIGFFQPVKLSFVYTDTALEKKETDSLFLSRAVFTQFVPDSVLTAIYKKTNPKIFALGKTEGPAGEHYLFVKTIAPANNQLLVLAFDKKEKYLATLHGLSPDKNPATTQLFTLDRRFTITRTTQLRNKDGSTNEGKDVYAFDVDAKTFTLIMTDALGDKKELINPIDTFSRTHKWSADYTAGNKNLVSIRDGRRSGSLQFYVHFDKNNSECTGELKGEATIRTATTAEYNKKGDPCILKFVFSSTTVTLQEVEGCGSKRPMNCTLNGSFKKVKNPKTVAN